MQSRYEKEAYQFLAVRPSNGWITGNYGEKRLGRVYSHGHEGF